MSNKEAEREEMKEETHDVEDMEQDDLDEEDTEDEGPWINQYLIDRESINEIMQKEMQFKDNTEFLTYKCHLYIKRLYVQQFLFIYGRLQEKEETALQAKSIIDSLFLKCITWCVW